MLVHQNVVVREGLNLTLDLTMTVGAINETVEVRADTPLLESRTVAQGVNISGDLQRALCIPLGIACESRPIPSTVFCR